MSLIGLREMRFIRYSAVGVSTFLFDLALLWVLIDLIKLHYLVATALAFLVAVSINYLVSRVWVFVRTHRTFFSGYVYFLQFAILGALATTALKWVGVELLALPALYSRVGIAGVVGVFNYLGNLYLNFKVVGVPLTQEDQVEKYRG